MVRKPKLLSSIRAKLFSAVAMLLVAVIMVVSSTYAWFTLSTAPEVTGMTTAIGANGALEMALMPADGIMTSIRDGVLDANASQSDRNLYWGNLVDLSDNTAYGMDKIVLLPSALNVENDIIKTMILNVPKYGADGRVTELVAAGTSSYYDTVNGKFYPWGDTSAYGVRAVGQVSGMTSRQLAYINARSDANTAMVAAKTAAGQSLNSRGNALAAIAIKKGTSSADATYTQGDIDAINLMITDLEGIFAEIDKAYMNYILAYAASSLVGDNELAWKAVEGEIAKDGATAKKVIDAIQALTEGAVTMPASFTNVIEKLETSKGNIATAKNAMPAEADAYVWGDFSASLNLLANTDAMEICGVKASDIMKDDETTGEANMNKIVSAVTGGKGIEVVMKTGGGVYADVADHCGDYNASITIAEISYGGLSVTNVNARMKTAGTTPTYLATLSGEVANKQPENTSAEAMPVSEFYGYILDFVFRTNASNSDLLLQTEGIDRIYDENSNPETMGHGSNMTFSTDSPSFSNDQIKSLMSNIRIVFFDPTDTGDTASGEGASTSGAATGKVLAYARLDATNAAIDENGALVASVVLCDADGVIRTGDDATTIKALNQNEATPISVLVYLDGLNLTNADVAYEVAKSVTGKMNLQFSSSATLVPMENGDLHQQNATPVPPAEEETTATPEDQG